MSFSNQGRFRQQVCFLRQQFLQDGELPFTDVLSEETITQALQALNVVWLDRIYSPLVTLWVFLSQVLSQDHSCRAAVARLIAYRVSRGRRPCSADTGAYCQARKRLPEKFFLCVARLVGKNLDDQVAPAWLWKGRPVYMFDGTTVSMPDTPENQAAYPQVYNQKPGLGFPIARICTIMSLSCGAVLDMGISRYAGKKQGELSLLRKMWDILSSGDILLTDALMSTWHEMLTLEQRGVDSVSRLNKALRKADFRRGKRLGKDDHIVRWLKPSSIRHLDWATYKQLPDYLEVRETRIRVVQPGFRTKEIVVVTTLLDPEATTKEDLASLYRSRWSQELDIRDIKISLQMDVLRCKIPELVRKEIWTHILAYNLIRTIMAQAASQHGVQPREISFKGTMQTLEAFQPLVSFLGHKGLAFRQQFYLLLLKAVATHRVADRPDRFEPRKRKRNPRKAERMTKPRWELKRLMRKGVTDI
jgi:Transposase DDE domain